MPREEALGVLLIGETHSILHNVHDQPLATHEIPNCLTRRHLGEFSWSPYVVVEDVLPIVERPEVVYVETRNTITLIWHAEVRKGVRLGARYDNDREPASEKGRDIRRLVRSIDQLAQQTVHRLDVLDHQLPTRGICATEYKLCRFARPHRASWVLAVYERPFEPRTLPEKPDRFAKHLRWRRATARLLPAPKSGGHLADELRILFVPAVALHGASLSRSRSGLSRYTGPGDTGRCPECNGYGSSLKQETGRCTRCGGSGLVAIPTQRLSEPSQTAAPPDRLNEPDAGQPGMTRSSRAPACL